MGLSEVVSRLGVVLRALRQVGRTLKSERPALAILVDFPDFNFWVARLARFYRVPVMYYISPQVWAWRTYRVRTIARLVDRMVVIFPFEADFYRERGVPVTHVGHPLMETLPILADRRTLLAQWGLEPERLTIALLPGSRASEIERHLPTMLAAAALIRRAIPPCQFLLPLASTAPAEMVKGMVKRWWGEGAGDPGLANNHFRPILPGPGRRPPGGGGLGHGHGGGGPGRHPHGHRLPGVAPDLPGGAQPGPGGPRGHGQSFGRRAALSGASPGRLHPGATGPGSAGPNQ